MIRALQVTKTYGKGDLAFRALRGVDFEARGGEVVIVAGPSGSGKTTLLSILGCILRPTAGEVWLGDERISDRSESELPALRLAWVGFVFQAANLIPSLTAVENVALLLRLRGRSARDATREARALCEELGLGDRMDAKPAALSGGQRQRVAVARAVAGSPPILLADEPTASLDAESGHAVITLLRQMADDRGHAVVIVTHDSRIFPFADRIVRIEDGLIVEENRRAA